MTDKRSIYDEEPESAGAEAAFTVYVAELRAAAEEEPEFIPLAEAFAACADLVRALFAMPLDDEDRMEMRRLLATFGVALGAASEA